MTTWSLLSCVLAVTAAYAAGIAVFPLLRRRDSASTVTQWLVAATCVALLFVVPSEQVVLRALTALPLTDLLLRVIDFGRQSRSGRTAACSWRDYCEYLVPVPLLLVVFGQKDRRIVGRQTRWMDLAWIIAGGALFGVGWVCLSLAQACPALRSSFWLDHAVKLVVWVFAIESAAHALAGVERLLGFDTGPIIRYSFLSRTPAEFWTRWNQRVHGWLYVNAFLPSGGMRSPARGIATAFLVSAVLHEVMFSAATSRIDGYQAAFFLAQIPAVLGSRWLEGLPARWGAAGIVVAHLVTIAWIGASSIFFFHGIHRIFPFYYAAEPWLP